MESSFSNLSFDEETQNDSNDNLAAKAGASFEVDPAFIRSSIESPVDLLISSENENYLSDVETKQAPRTRNISVSPVNYMSPEMKPIGGSALSPGVALSGDDGENMPREENASLSAPLSSLTSYSTSICEEPLDVEFDTASDENLTVENKMFQKCSIKDSSKLIESLKIENFNLKLRIYYFEQESSFSDRELRIQPLELKHYNGNLESDTTLCNVNLNVERDNLHNKLQAKDKLLTDAKKVIGSLSKDDSLLRSEKGVYDKEMANLRQRYETSLETVKQELNKKNEELIRLKDAQPENSNGHSAYLYSPKLDIESRKETFQKLESELNTARKDLERKSKMLSAYEEKLSRIETEHLSCSDSEAAARANTESQIRILTEERDQLKRNLRSRERDWTNSLEEIQRLQLNENDKNQEMSVLQMKVKELQIEVSNLRKNSDSDQWELEKVKKEKNDLEHKVDVLENAMKEGVNHSEEVRDLQSKIDDLNSALKAKNTELESCDKDKHRLQEHLERSEAKLRENNYERKKLADELAALQRNLEEAERKSTEQKYSINSLLKDNSKISMEKEDLKEKIQDLQNDLERSSRSLNELETKNRQLTSENDSLSESLRKLNSELSNLQIKFKNLQYENSAKDGEIDELKAKVNEMKSQLSAEEYSVATLQEELNQLLTAKEEIDETLSLLRADNSRKDTKVFDLSDKIEELEKFKSSLNKNMSEVETENSCLKLEVDDKSSEIAALKDKINDFHVEVAKLQKEMQAKDDIISTAKRSLGSKENVLNSTMTELACLKTEIEALKAERGVSKRRISDLETTKTELERALSEKQKELDIALLKVRDSESEKEFLGKELEDREFEINEKNKELDAKEKELENVSDKNNALEKSCQEKTSDLRKLELENHEKAQLWDSLTSKLENDLQKKHSEIERLREMNDDLKSQLDNGNLKVALLEDQKAVNEANLRKENEFVLRELDRLKGTVVDLEQIKKRLETISSNKDSESHKLRINLEEKDAEIEKLRNFKVKAEKELQEVRNDVKEGALRHQMLCSPENSLSEETAIKSRPVFKREKSFYQEGCDLNNSSLFESYQNTSSELKKLIDAANRELESSRLQVIDLSGQVDSLKHQILRSEAVFDDMHEQLDREKSLSKDLQTKLDNLKLSMVKSVGNKACNTESQNEDYSGIYFKLMELAGNSPRDANGTSNTEASIAGILALVEKITHKLQKYKADSKAKDQQVRDLKVQIEQLVRTNDSSCNQSDSNSVASIDVQYQNGFIENRKEKKGDEKELQMCQNCGLFPGNGDVLDRDGKISYAKLEREYRLKLDELETVKLEFDEYKIEATQKRADLAENVAELKFNIRTLEQKLAISMVEKGVNKTFMKSENDSDGDGTIAEDLQQKLSEAKAEVVNKEVIIKGLEEGLKEMEATFASTVNSLQDLLATKDKAVQGLCDKISNLKSENLELKEKESGSDVAASKISDSGGARVDQLIKASQEKLEQQMKEMQLEHETHCTDLQLKLNEAEKSVEKLSCVLSARQNELHHLHSQNSSYKERIQALEKQMESTSHTIDNVLMNASPRVSPRGSNIGPNARVTQSFMNSNLTSQDLVTQDHKRRKVSNMLESWTQTELTSDVKRSKAEVDPILQQLDNYRCQLLAAEADYKQLNDKFIAMKSVLSLQADKIRIQRELLKSAFPPTELRSSSPGRSSRMKTEEGPHRSLGQSKTPRPKESHLPPPLQKERSKQTGHRKSSHFNRNENVRPSFQSATSTNPLAKSNSSEHDGSRQSISKDEVASAPAVVGLAKNNSSAEIRSSRKSARKSRGLGGKFSRDNDVTGDGDARSRSVCDLTLSVASAHKFTREETNDDTLNCSENLSDEEQGQDPASLLEHSKPSSNIHIPNIGDLMFEVKRLSKMVENHDASTSQLLHQIHGSTVRNSFNPDSNSVFRDLGGDLRVNTRMGGPDQLTPPTKDISGHSGDFDSKSSGDGNDALRELNRLICTGTLVSHQILVSKIQTQFSKDTALIDSLKIDLKSQVQENEELKECLTHLIEASKRLELSLTESLNVVQHILVESMKDSLPETEYAKLKISLNSLGSHKSLLSQFNANPTYHTDIESATKCMLKQLQDSLKEAKKERFGDEHSYPSHANPRLSALMNDNKRLVEILERKDAEIDYLLRLRKSSTSQKNSENSQQVDANGKVFLLTDKLNRLLDENKDLRESISRLNREEHFRGSQSCKDVIKGDLSGCGDCSAMVIGTTFTNFHQLRDQISDARILAKTASVRLTDRLDCGHVNLLATSPGSADVPLLNSLSREVTSVAKSLEVCQNNLLKFKRVYFDQQATKFWDSLREPSSNNYNSLEVLPSRSANEKRERTRVLKG